jgi:DNA-binding CsgD family transcriptional regulator
MRIHLTRRETEVLGYLSAGLRNREIAEHMSISLTTVGDHIKNLHRKAKATNRVQMLRAFQEHLPSMHESCIVPRDDDERAMIETFLTQHRELI